jgi:hypothetical protein
MMDVYMKNPEDYLVGSIYGRSSLYLILEAALHGVFLYKLHLHSRTLHLIFILVKKKLWGGERGNAPGSSDGRQVMAKAHIPVLDITSFFFRIHVQGKALVLRFFYRFGMLGSFWGCLGGGVNAKYIRVVEILLSFIWVDGQGTITSKSRTFVVLHLATNVALIEYT